MPSAITLTSHVFTRHVRAARFLVALFGLAGALAASPLTTELSAVKRVVTRNAQGGSVETWAPFTKLLPGEQVAYTIACTNTGDQPTANVVVDLPIPAEMTFVPADTPMGAELTCSIDGGRTFGPLELIRVVAPDGASRPARAADVGLVRWRLTQPLAPGATAKVHCLALLK